MVCHSDFTRSSLRKDDKGGLFLYIDIYHIMVYYLYVNSTLKSLAKWFKNKHTNRQSRKGFLMQDVPTIKLTEQRSDEITAAVRAYVEKRGWGWLLSIEHLWECLLEITADGSLESDPDVPREAQEAAAHLLAESKIPLDELYVWAVAQDQPNSEAHNFRVPSRGPSLTRDQLDRLTDVWIAQGLL